MKDKARNLPNSIRLKHTSFEVEPDSIASVPSGAGLASGVS